MGPGRSETGGGGSAGRARPLAAARRHRPGSAQAACRSCQYPKWLPPIDRHRRDAAALAQYGCLPPGGGEGLNTAAASQRGLRRKERPRRRSPSL